MVNSIKPKRKPNHRARILCSPEMLARVRDWMEREISFVENRVFSEPNAANRLAASRPASLDGECVAEASQPGVAFVTGMVDTPLLAPGEETYLFTWMNFLKYRAEQSRQRLDLNRPDGSLVDRIEADLKESISVRNHIVRSNLRLVVALARKLAQSTDQMSELIGEATVPLIRAVELFDVALGNRFSTYATWAVRNHMLRCLKRKVSLHERTVVHDHVWMDRLTDERTNPDDDARLSAQRTEFVQELLLSLSERERLVVTARFGLDGQPHGQSLQEIADRIGLSKERVRQIAISAVEKLQGIAKTSSSAL